MNNVSLMPEQIGWVLQQCNPDLMKSRIEKLMQWDRFQASQGINRAAEQVAKWAGELGWLEYIEILYFEANGQSQWWDFQAPLAWTPLRATFQFQQLRLDHRVQPYALATYSCSGSDTFLLVDSHCPDESMQGKIVVIAEHDFVQHEWIYELTHIGAAGFVTDAMTRQGFRGRIELPPDSPLFAFSVTTDEMALLQNQLNDDNQCYVDILIDDSAPMPVVTALSPGESSREIWLTAHLCHSRAGANDNLSGIVALLETARLLQLHPGIKQDYRIRLVWGPEFLGVAALQHVLQEQAPPLVVINLDMVGEDQAQFRSPFCIEFPPEHLHVPWVNEVTRIIDEVFHQTSDYPGEWREVPFSGFSDHALFMNYCDPEKNSPSIQLCHIDDPYNHCAGDTLDKVSSVELKRSVAVVIALLVYLQQQNISSLSIRPRSPLQCGHLYGHWDGPLNLRVLIQKLPAHLRTQVQQHIKQDKCCLAVLHRMLLHADGCRTMDQIYRTSLRGMEKTPTAEALHVMAQVLEHSEWVTRVNCKES
ncbi:DUF4910 domain-containing protein [Vibrio ruber]|uniref:DUF4910 domain-containing protein n=1 Tax=Vibrio ruber TaxID=184755 RepID=UPI0028933192|nr:DUF4910 domain-containing protein [Vibrio ruber]WNJ97299.1 DUF4910 domain-containing protein [Vibrio ruber]